jgi:hypothetical protein
MKQLVMPGFQRISGGGRQTAPAPKKPDLVLMQAIDAHSTSDLEAALEAIKAAPESPGMDAARRLVVGVLAYRTARDSKQGRLF